MADVSSILLPSFLWRGDQRVWQAAYLSSVDWSLYDASESEVDVAKEAKPTKAETPFRRFQRLARRIVSVPKGKTKKEKDSIPHSS